MAGRRLYTLKTERENLIDKWKDSKENDRVKILVQIMDLDEDIATIAKEEKRPARLLYYRN